MQTASDGSRRSKCGKSGRIFNAGASFAGIASGIFNRQDIIEQREEHLRTSIREAEKKIRQLREAQEE